MCEGGRDRREVESESSGRLERQDGALPLRPRPALSAPVPAPGKDSGAGHSSAILKSFHF